MAKQIKVSCKGCDQECPTLPLSSEQYQRVLGCLKTGNPKDVAYTTQLLQMELVAVFCFRRQETVLVGKKDDLPP